MIVKEERTHSKWIPETSTVITVRTRNNLKVMQNRRIINCKFQTFSFRSCFRLIENTTICYSLYKIEFLQ